MPLATRCPHCETVFRISPEHLKLHGGLARCGHCQQVFDAVNALVDPDSELAPPAAEPASTAGAAPPPPRVFPATAPHAATTPPMGASFEPGAWDMRAPWLDGGIDPTLRHHGGNTGPAPLLPVAAAAAREVPANEAGLARGEPVVPPASGSAPVATPAADPASERVPGPLPAPASEPVAESAAAPAREPAPAPADATPAAPADHGPGSGLAAPAHGASDADLAGLVAALPRAMAEPSFGAAPPAGGHDDGARAPRGGAESGAPGMPPRETEPFAVEPEQDDRIHFAMTRESPAGRRGSNGRQMLGGFLAGLLIVVLAGQLAWWLREPLLTNWPAAQPLFARACAALGCTVEPPRAIDGLRLGASDLRQLDGPRVLELKVPLSNHAALALAYPSIELTLLDASNHVAARRVLAPADYVPPGTRIEAGLAAGTTETMFVRIDTAPGAADGAPGIAASNFRVQIFYP
ncbi:DUF3426 domain-containing protein [Burkholderia glumae]|uniref:Zinc-ribbon domain-containing protein n=5 Tax=Burkholderia glumae TaxID=337 RepID=A0AAP9Y580_BURGL|nr:DUF3426 domain-containing protein [Burkholderia glumae]ACR27700.1 Zinc finger/thioredoxin domain-containing protein [Burkholderia glumae BGR1]AJY68064.1 family finger-like domain protein [Burkholderia glumae LMG 2196 = ATCC 33617]MCM2481320.1 zinc-ribbon domain-containing protein [Burkholderia glumae]MCM2508540.1 zinc-ribbon domain-containing protein [Burkholderia glumae]MCM2537008.1 zinc-ribbon domain-containing protein [Burkholderia glumae]